MKRGGRCSLGICAVIGVKRDAEVGVGMMDVCEALVNCN